MYSFPNLEPVNCFMSGSNCCFLTCIQVSQEVGKVVWYSHLLKNFPQFVVIHVIKGFSIVIEAEIFLEFSCSFFFIMMCYSLYVFYYICIYYVLLNSIFNYLLSFFFFFFWLRHCLAGKILVPWPGINPCAAEVWSPTTEPPGIPQLGIFFTYVHEEYWFVVFFFGLLFFGFVIKVMVAS